MGTNIQKTGKVYPLTAYERGMYISQKLDPQSTEYNLNILLIIEGASSKDVKAAITKIFAAHEVFHSYYGEQDGKPVRIISENLPAIDEKAAADRAEAIAIAEKYALPFDLEKDIPVRPTVYTAADGCVILHLATHHITFDGGSVRTFWGEFNKALCNEAIEPLKYDLSDIWDRKIDKENGLAYYRKLFENGVPVCEMPIKGKRPEIHPVSDSIITDKYDASELKKLEDTAKKLGITKFELFFAAISMVLGKYTSSEEVVIGVPTNMRPSDAKYVIGMFVNTAPVLVRPSRNMNVREYIENSAAAIHNATHGKSVPFEDLVSEFAKARDKSRNPIFDVSLNYLYEIPQFENNGIKTLMYVPLQNLRRDFVINIRVCENSLSLMIQYSSELFEEEVVNNFVEQIRYTVNSICEDSGQTVRECTALPEAQKEKLMRFSVTAEEKPEYTLLHRLFEKNAAEYADKTALIAEDATLTYRELNEKANIVANNLIAKGIRPNDSVALLLPRKSFFLSCLFGVLKAGAAFIPCDPQYPSERINHIIQDSGASFIITTADKLAYYPEDKAIDVESITRGENTDTPNVDITGDSLAYMIYTSGSTGVPKGVMLKHEGICNYLRPHPANIHMKSVHDLVNTYLSITTVSFDMSFREHTASLCNGKTLVFASDNDMNDPRALARLMEKYNVDCINATPSRLQQYLYNAAFCERLKYCKCIMAGGELYPISLRNKIKEIAPNARLLNTYGPTEITVSCNVGDLTNAEYVTVGKPLLNYKEYIVDKFGDIAPFGAAGELYVGGIGVGKGYRNLEKKTAELFVTYNGERMYRTGDLAKWDNEGRVLIIGRLDSQIKLRGLRIELGEIESVIGSFDGIREAAVAVKTINNTEHIAAYFTADKQIDIDALKNHAASKLTHYMVPTAYMQLEEMPHTFNGKKDMKNLPDPIIAEKAESSAKPHQLTAFERDICQLAEKAIGSPIDEVGIDLMNLGMTSLTAISFATFVEEKYGCEIPVSKLMKGLSILQTEDIIYESLLHKGSIKKDTVKTELSKEYPLSFNQLGVYYEVIKQPEELLYNMPLCCIFENVDAVKLKAALERAVECHSYLNTHIEVRNGKLVQVRNDDAKADIPITEMTKAEFEERKKKFVRPFDLHKDILYRFEIIITDKKTYLLSDFHHIIFDGLSRGLFMDTVSKAYSGENTEAEQLSYFDYALGESEYKESNEYHISEQYFTDMMSEFETAAEIPSDKSGRIEEGRIGTVDVMLEKGRVKNFCKEKAITPASLFLAAAFYAVSRFANNKNVYISTISSGRVSSQTRRTVGMFVHTLPLHINFNKKMTADELLKAANASMLGGMENEAYPFMQLADKYGYRTEIMYECQLGVSGSKNSIGEAAYKTEYLKLEAPKFKVTIAIEDKNGRIAVTIRYNNAIYTDSYMRTLAESVKTVVLSLMEGENTDVSKLSLVTDEERQRIISMGVSAKQDIPVKLLHRIFEQRTSETPLKTALIASDKTLTYKELNDEANRIANSLIDKNVRLGDSIVLLLPRRSFYFGAMFGVLKAGAAFIPCDPQYPPERIRHIIDASGARFVITTKDHTGEHPAEQTLIIDDLLAGENTSSPNVDVTEQDIAYMIYTSGSTGKPKGVMITHLGICNYLEPHKANIHMKYIRDHVNCCLAVATVSFDTSFKEHAALLCNGKTFVFANEEQMNDPVELTKLMAKHNIDAMNATPSRYMQYLEYKPFAEALAKCSLVMAGGEAFPDVLLKRMREYGIKNIANSYGPTEITVSSNLAVLDDAKHISVGRPLLNYSEYIVDSDMNIVPQGVVGELLIGGAGVAKGYCNLPEQTAERFIEYNGQRVYRSGDYARWDEDGNVIILGRMDSQIKLRGFRIELGEIEGLIDSQPHIKKSIVTVKKLGDTDTLCAYYTADCEIKPEELKAQLAKSLTHYMVPTAYLQLDTIPVTPNGKTDMKALPDPVPVSSGEYSAPVNDTERYFCELFGRVLKLDKVGATDNFFDIGGTSLLVTSVAIDAAEHGFEITYGDIFRRSTPRDLANMFVSDKIDEVVKIVDFAQYDYSKITKLLSHNNMSSLLAGKTRPVGNIMLTGATGFMGIHVLAHFLKHEKGKAFCLLRKGRFDDPLIRLKNVYFYYFNDADEAEFENRVIAFNGDVTDYKCFEAMEELPIDTVFNCAANVKHFSSGTDIEDVNVGGAANCVKFCKKKGVRLIHFSTTSVSGNSVDNCPPISSVLDEQTLYMGQRLDTKYSNSKLLSERVVLEAAAEQGLDAKVIRVGTLSARESDGEFQMNFLTNNFSGRLRSYGILGCFPYSMINSPICMGPIDESVRAFFALASVPKECCLFNCTNNHIIPLGDIITEMNRAGIDIKFVEDAVFDEAVAKAEKDPQKAAILSSMIAYKNMAHGKKTVPIRSVNNYTTQVLAQTGFFWKNTDEKYIRKYINALSSLGFFDSNNLTR
ncbi:MAG: amino acid adenylation domain-containing protein [Firmicutes bacterium]|nr:amino acid adenylation domain-containing protein [Bacillota bacterium]